MITVQTLKSKIPKKLHGTNLSKIGTMYEEIAEAANTMLARIDPPDTIQRSRIDSAIFNMVYNYTCPSDLKGIDRLLDIRPIGPRSRWDDMTISGIKEFDIRKYRDSLVIETINGVKTLRISKMLGGNASRPMTLSALNTVDSTITSSGDVTSPVVDTLDYVNFNSSISFGLSGSTGAGHITITTSPQTFDLSTLLNLGTLFHWFKFPDSTRFTSLVLKFGSNASNYWSVTVTAPQGRTAVDTAAWDLMAYNWASASKTGSPSESALAYFDIGINYTAGVALTFCKVNSLWASLGAAYESIYYSNAIFRTAATGALKTIPTLDSDIITLDPTATNILMYETQKVLAQQIKGKNMGSDMADINYKLEGDGRVLRGLLVANRGGLYRDYIAQNPSQAIPPQQSYYDFGELDGFGDGNDDNSFIPNN